jgi:tetratricopeptide (TPR) repeat protein
MALYQEKGPLQALSRIYSKQKQHGKMYHDLKGTDFGWYGMSVFYMLRNDQQEFLKAAADEAMKDKSELPGLKWLAASLNGPYGSFYQQRGGVDAITLYEKAREWVPNDPEILQELADLYAQRNDGKKAIAAATELVAALDAGALPAGTKRWSRERALLAVADAHRQAGDLDASRAIFDKLDVLKADLQPHELWLASTVLEQCERIEAAAAALGRCEEEGYRPYLRLAGLWEKLQNWTEAVRCYNRAIRFGFDADIPSPEAAYRQIIRSVEQPAKAPPTPDKLRDTLMKKIGENYFIDKFLAGALPPMTPEEKGRATRLYDDICGDELVARDAAEDELRKMGPKVAPVLRAGLDSSDDETRTRCRNVLNDWAEPR